MGNSRISLILVNIGVWGEGSSKNLFSVRLVEGVDFRLWDDSFNWWEIVFFFTALHFTLPSLLFFFFFFLLLFFFYAFSFFENLERERERAKGGACSLQVWLGLFLLLFFFNLHVHTVSRNSTNNLRFLWGVIQPSEVFLIDN